MAYTIVLDAGHGGSDPGAVYNGRQEKDDSLRLTMEVGKVLSNNGYNVIYTRTTDDYNTPFEKATIANEENADLFVSIHRNSSPVADMFNGVQTLVYSDDGVRADLARNINQNLVQLGYENQGVVARPNLVVLKRTKMPAVLVEAGFINSTADNQIFDGRFNEVAAAIANGIIETVGTQMNYQGMTNNNQNVYDVYANQMESGEMDDNRTGGNEWRGKFVIQAGAFRNRLLAENLTKRLVNSGFPAVLINEKGLFKVWIGEYSSLDNAVSVERKINELGYDSYIRVIGT